MATIAALGYQRPLDYFETYRLPEYPIFGDVSPTVIDTRSAICPHFSPATLTTLVVTSDTRMRTAESLLAAARLAGSATWGPFQ
jgi:hypothetical protein